MTKFITKNKRVIPISIRKMSDADLDTIYNEGNTIIKKAEREHGDAYVLKNKKLDALAQKVADAYIEKRNRASQKLDEDFAKAQKEHNKDPDVKAFKKLQKNPKFHINPTHTIGWIDEKIDFPKLGVPKSLGQIFFGVKGEGFEVSCLILCGLVLKSNTC